jgi:hypothetical protein
MSNSKQRDDSAKSAEKGNGAHPEAAQPIFYKNPVPIDLKRHGKSGVMPLQNCKFAANTNSIIVNLAEFVEAAKSYPIVFTNDEASTPAAVVGLEKINYFVDEKGKWREDTYIPAYIRRYPFVLMHVPEKKQFILCVDEASEQFCSADAEGAVPFYSKDEQPSDVIKSVLEFSLAFQEQYALTQQFSAALKDAGLLMPHTSNLTLTNGQNISLGGFQMIDEKKLNDLPDKKILDLRKKGFLPYIYIALASISNWKRLGDLAAVHASKNKAA